MIDVSRGLSAGKEGNSSASMLQPLQLKDVSARYAAEIAEVREFLAKAGVPVGTAEALGGMAARLPRDRAFHRDLISNIWVMLEKSNGQISYSDLLGLLAIAAAGAEFAALADEDDAHNLLRFLMEARHSLDSAPDEKPAIAPVRPSYFKKVSVSEPRSIAPEEPLETSRTPIEAKPEVSDTLIHPRLADSFAREEPEPSSNRTRGIWVAGAACLLLAVGGWLYQRQRSSVAAPVVQSVPPAASTGTFAASTGTTVMSPREGGSTAVSRSRETASAEHAWPVRKTGQGSSFRPAPAEHNSPAIVQSVPSHSAAVSTPVPTSAPTTAPASAQTMAAVRPAPSNAAPVIRSAGPFSVAPIALRPTSKPTPAATSVPPESLSKRLGARNTPTDLSAYGVDSDGKKHPELKRRQPIGSAGTYSERDSNLVAEVRPGSIAGMPRPNYNSAGAVRGGVVRAASEGIMSANILYSPAPAYPAAASAAHVQGEVRVKAAVDRQGNVASVRIISGPPLLRDAALDAVQRWRFRPYVAAGKPIPMSATAIVDFQLE